MTMMITSVLFVKEQLPVKAFESLRHHSICMKPLEIAATNSTG